MGLKERLNAFLNRKSPQELLALYGEPRKIFELNDYFSPLDLVAQATRYVHREFHGKPGDPFPYSGRTLQDAAMGIVFSEHVVKIERILRRNHRIDSGLYNLVWIVDPDYNRKEYWKEIHGHVYSLSALQDEILPITKHGQIWWMYTDKGFREPLFAAWPEIEEKYLPRSVTHYQAQYHNVVESNRRSIVEEQARVATHAFISAGVTVEFADGMSRTYACATYHIENGMVVITPYADGWGERSLPPILLPSINIKSVHKNV